MSSNRKHQGESMKVWMSVAAAFAGYLIAALRGMAQGSG